MGNEKEVYLIAEELIQRLLIHYSESLDEETKNEVLHYLKHDEYEMAFEGVFIELMNLEIVFSENEFSNCFSLGKKLSLDKKSVFDVNFWDKLSSYCSKC